MRRRVEKLIINTHINLLLFHSSARHIILTSLPVPVSCFGQSSLLSDTHYNMSTHSYDTSADDILANLSFA